MSKRVLVVEDNADNMTLMCDILEAFGYATVKARNGAEGVAAAEREIPDLILMDLSMPQMDGWTATRQIKALPALRAIPVIALTAHAMLGDRDRAMEAGCDDYITKPISLRSFSETIRKYLP
ncbi:MAG: response regulator [Anaerolineae bacterium]|nr:response regulator [Anaerolineae bacterium]NUQ05972.1 response regulator [Anaerolineae bacterium]